MHRCQWKLGLGCQMTAFGEDTHCYYHKKVEAGLIKTKDTDYDFDEF